MDLERKGGSISATSALLNHLNMERLAQDTKSPSLNKRIRRRRLLWGGEFLIG